MLVNLYMYETPTGENIVVLIKFWPQNPVTSDNAWLMKYMFTSFYVQCGVYCILVLLYCIL